MGGIGLLYNTRKKKTTTTQLGTTMNVGGTVATTSNKFLSGNNSFTYPHRADASSSMMSPDSFNSGIGETVNKPASLSSGGTSAMGNAFASGGSNTAGAATDVAGKSAGKSAFAPMSGAAQGASAVAGAGVSMLTNDMEADAGIQEDNIDLAVDQNKMANAGGISGAAKGAQMGMQFGPWGALIGGVVGGAAGYFGGKKKGKEMEMERKRLVKNRNIGRMHEGQAKLADKSNALAQAAQMRYGYAKKGGKFYVSTFVFGLSSNDGPIIKIVREPLKAFKRGGKIDNTTNIIPNGVSHEEENVWGTKGQPVVKCKKESCEKVYEIESDELILTLKTTHKIEELVGKKDKKALGKLLMNELVNNTHSYSKNYNFVNEGI